MGGILDKDQERSYMLIFLLNAAVVRMVTAQTLNYISSASKPLIRWNSYDRHKTHLIYRIFLAFYWLLDLVKYPLRNRNKRREKVKLMLQYLIW